MRKHRRAVALYVIAIGDPRGKRVQQFPQHALALDQGRGANVKAVEIKQIKRVKHQPVRAAGP